MNKKVFVLLTLPFVLASCHGQSISRETAIEILGNIEKVNDEKIPFNFYTFLSTIDEESNKSEQKHFYSIPDKYYHGYTCLNGSVSEEWCYVKADDEGINHIYNVNRIVDSSINEETAPRYVSKITDYSEESWEELHNHYARILLLQTSTLIGSLKAYLQDKPDESTLVLESYGSDALYAKRTITDSSNNITYEREVEFSDNCLVKYSFKSQGGSPKNRTYSVTYISTEIFYPKID